MGVDGQLYTRTVCVRADACRLAEV